MNGASLLAVIAAVAVGALAVAGGSPGGLRGCAPKLTILSPAAGDTVRTPFPVRYRVSCFNIGPAPAGHIELAFGPIRTQRIALAPGTTRGVATVPRDPRLSGRRTLVFRLARADRTLLTNPKARATVGPLLIVGPR